MDDLTPEGLADAEFVELIPVLTAQAGQGQDADSDERHVYLWLTVPHPDQAESTIEPGFALSPDMAEEIGRQMIAFAALCRQNAGGDGPKPDSG